MGRGEENMKFLKCIIAVLYGKNYNKEIYDFIKELKAISESKRETVSFASTIRLFNDSIKYMKVANMKFSSNKEVS